MPERPIEKLPIAWDEKDRLWIKCISCGHKWYPDARRWRDRDSKDEYKNVRCPKCSHVNKLKPILVRWLKRQARKEPEYGFDKEE